MDDPRAARLRQAFELFEVAEALVEQRLRREGVPAAQRIERLRAWRQSRPHAPKGDAAGVAVNIRRFR